MFVRFASRSNLYMPIDEAKTHLPDVRFTVPYSRLAKQQMLDGKLYEKVNYKKFNEKFKAIVEKIVKKAPEGASFKLYAD